MIEKCPLCNNDAEFSEDFERDISYFDCPRCGNYGISMEAETDLKNPEDEKTKYILSGITRYITDNNLKRIILYNSNINELKDLYFVPRDIFQKINLLLRYFAKKSNYPGDKVKINYGLDYTITFSKNVNEFIFLVEYLEKNNFINPSLAEISFSLTVDGWKRIEELNTQVIDKKQGFIAMWFDESLNEVYINGFRKAIKDCKYEPMRIDLKEHNNKIDDEIIAEIRNSKFLIADFTGDRGGVYFEAGFAKGLDIPVIWTCRKDEIEKLHFDTRQFNHITWENTKDLYTQLVNRIKATIK